MLYEIKNHIHNFFPVKGAAITGKITIGEWIFDTHIDATADAKDLRYSGAAIRLTLQDGQYYLISGSIFNDGVYQYHKGDTAPLQEETFDGVVVPLAIPKPFLSLVDEISEWQTKNGNQGAYQSESFGGYSYSRATNSKGEAYTWQDAFRARLNPWRKMA